MYKRREIIIEEKFLSKVKEVEMNNNYKGDNLIVGIRYGSEGIIPCHNKCEGTCISSSGDNLCGNYGGHCELNVEDKILYIVRCAEAIKCENHN